MLFRSPKAGSGPGEFTPQILPNASLLLPPACPRPQVPSHPSGTPPDTHLQSSCSRTPAVSQQHKPELTPRALRRQWPSGRTPQRRPPPCTAHPRRRSSRPGQARALRIPSEPVPARDPRASCSAYACSPAEPHWPRAPFHPRRARLHEPTSSPDPLSSRPARNSLPPQDGSSPGRGEEPSCPSCPGTHRRSAGKHQPL